MNSFHLGWPLVRRLPPLGTLRAFEAAARHLSFKEAARRTRPHAHSNQPPGTAARGVLRREAVPPSPAPARALGCRSEVIPGNSRRLRRIRVGSIVTPHRSGGKAAPRNDHQRVREPLVGPSAQSVARGARRYRTVDHWCGPGGEDSMPTRPISRFATPAQRRTARPTRFSAISSIPSAARSCSPEVRRSAEPPIFGVSAHPF